MHLKTARWFERAANRTDLLRDAIGQRFSLDEVRHFMSFKRCGVVSLYSRLFHTPAPRSTRTTLAPASTKSVVTPNSNRCRLR